MKEVTEADLFEVLERDFELGAHHRAIAEAAMQARARWIELRDRIDADGVVVKSRCRDGFKAHPLLAAERAARESFVRLIRELNLDDADPSRKPRRGPPRRGRPKKLDDLYPDDVELRKLTLEFCGTCDECRGLSPDVVPDAPYRCAGLRASQSV
jgi:hypothetical protein